MYSLNCLVGVAPTLVFHVCQLCLVSSDFIKFVILILFVILAK